MNFLVVVLCALAINGALSKPWDEMQMDERWVDWKMTFEKAYETKLVEQQRYLIWQQNLKNVILHNMHSEVSYQLGLNEFSDLGFEEFKQSKLGCYKIPENMIVNGTVKSFAERTFEIPAGQLPDTVDWRSQGYVAPVKNQGQCGSCWAFSTTGSLEGQTFRKTGTLPSLSEQNLIDCAGKYGDQGCNGGWMDYAFTYVKANHGIDSEVGYPYYARALGYCYYRQQYNIAKCTGFVDIPSGDEAALKAAVASIGPISVAIDATHASFSAYRTGVYYEPTCGNAVTSLDHAVLVVGYGTEKGQDYWLVKNSWGNAWGDQGYIKMSRNQNNQCGIATKASYPLV